MAEAAITMPVVLLVLMFGINLSLVSHTALVAANAANYGARIGSVTKTNPKFWAETAARTALSQSTIGGKFSEPFAQVDEAPGGAVTVTIHWEYPSVLSGLCSLFGGSCSSKFEGDAVALWKRERW
jgi:Flp pilus assembly protein TadG